MTAIRCRRCRSTSVSLLETTYEHHAWDGVTVVDGELRPTGEAVHTDGDVVPDLTRLHCLTCGYVWRPRRRVGYPLAWDGLDGDAAVRSAAG